MIKSKTRELNIHELDRASGGNAIEFTQAVWQSVMACDHDSLCANTEGGRMPVKYPPK